MENEEDKNKEQNAEAEALRVQLEQAKAQARTAADAVLATVPERFRALIPEGDPAMQLAWFNKIKQAGIFDVPTVPKTDEGKPTITPKTVDYADLPPVARMSSGYKR